MREYTKFYIDGGWTQPAASWRLEVFNPATDEVAGRIALGTAEDVDLAARAARRAFASWSLSTRAQRLELLQEIVSQYERRFEDFADAVTEEMGAPAALARRSHVPVGLAHLRTAIEALKTYSFEETRGATRIVKEPVGVCSFITPWNWPLNQIAAKVAPAIATGCTMILKPSEIAPFSGHIFAEVMHAAGVPAGVFNLVHGDGPTVGVALSTHREIDMVSFTGSTRAGVEVARNAAPTVKRVHQELGGKSPNIILDDEALVANVTRSTHQMMINSGQSCNAPSRMLVPAHRMAEAAAAAKAAAAEVTVGDPTGDVVIGPVASSTQYEKIQALIAHGLAEGAELVCGGPGRPAGLSAGAYVRPTIFSSVAPSMTVAREEIFGPVLTILPYENVDHAVAIGNDTEYGLAAYVNGQDAEVTRQIAARMRAGQVSINGATDRTAPFGGYKMSGNGREWGDYAFHEFLETKAVLGFAPA